LNQYWVFSDDLTGASGISSLVTGTSRITINTDHMHSPATKQFPFVAVNLHTRQTSWRGARAEFVRATGMVDAANLGLRIDSALRGHVGVYLGVLLGIRDVLLTDTIPEYNRYTLSGKTISPFNEKSISEIILTETNLNEARNELIIADSRTQEDLERLASVCIKKSLIPVDPGPLIALVARRRLGLERSDASHRGRPAPGRVSAIACVIGTHHKAAERQMTVLKRLGYTIQKPGGGSPGETDIFWFDLIREKGLLGTEFMQRLDHYDALVFSGGETANHLLTTAGFDYILNEDSFQPLVSIGTIVGGRWDGKTVVMKGGIIGDEDIFRRIFRWLRSR